MNQLSNNHSPLDSNVKFVSHNPQLLSQSLTLEWELYFNHRFQRHKHDVMMLGSVFVLWSNTLVQNKWMDFTVAPSLGCDM